MNGQTVIPTINDDNNLDSFYPGQNQLLLQELKDLLAGNRQKQVVYLWGESGCGKTHLLDACCSAAKQSNWHSLYISLKQGHTQLSNLGNICSRTFVCIDDLDQIQGLDSAQNQFFSIYESLINSRGAIVVSGDKRLSSIGLTLKDLESRLSSGGAYNVKPLKDDEKRTALKFRAEIRGFSLDDNVIEFIMSHYRRDTKSLFGLLDKLDAASLQAHRKITIPFVKSVL